MVRLLLSISMVFLLLLALVGLGYGAEVVAAGMRHPEVDILGALAVAYPLLLIGAIALGAMTIVLAIECSRADQVAALKAIDASVRWSGSGTTTPR